MTSRSGQIKDRLGNVGQIEEVIVAMRGLAATHSAEASRHLDAIRKQAATVERAMSEALALLPGGLPVPDLRQAPRMVVVVGAAQGFTGTFNEGIVSAALDRAPGAAGHRFLAVGQRCAAEFELRGEPALAWEPMAAHAAEVPALAGRIADTVFAAFARGEAGLVSLLYAEPGLSRQALAELRLLPFDTSRIAPASEAVRPLVNLPPPHLLARLIEEYVFTEICAALMLGFAAENDARMNAMTRARANVSRIGEELEQQFHQARQEETTTEITELSESFR